MFGRIALTLGEAYEILQLPEGASAEQVKKRFRDLSLQVHPDRVPIERREVATRQFQWLSLAKDTLLGRVRPGQPERREWEPELKTPQPDPRTQQIKEILLQLSKEMKLKAIRKGKESYGLQLSDTTGLLVGVQRDHIEVAIVLLSTWDTLKRVSVLHVNTLLKTIRGLVQEYSPKRTPQSNLDLEMIHKIEGWTASPYLVNLERSVRDGDTLDAATSDFVIFIALVTTMMSRLRTPLTTPPTLLSTRRDLTKRLEAIQTRVFRGMKPTRTQSEFVAATLEHFEGKKKPPPGPQTQPPKGPAIIRLQNIREEPEPKDFDRIRTILLKGNRTRIVSEAQLQARKITDLRKVLRRAVAAARHYFYPDPESQIDEGDALEVALIYLTRAEELGY